MKNTYDETELCSLAAEHGFRVVRMYTAEGAVFLLVDLACTAREEPLTALSSPGGLDAIAAQLAEHVVDNGLRAGGLA